MEMLLQLAMKIITGCKNLGMKIVLSLNYIQQQFTSRLPQWPLLDLEIFLGQIPVKNMCAFA